ncbi:MAG TPA: hypothetical protein VF614_13090 [Chthoniobacteraceae bacterium]
MRTLPLLLVSAAILSHAHAQSDAPIKATTTMHADGTRSTTVTNPDARTTEETLLDSGGKTIRRIVYALDERDLPTGATIYEKDGKMSFKSTYKRDSADRISEETILSANGQTLRRRVYSYGANNKISGVDEYDSNNALIPRAPVKTSPARPDKKKKKP